MTSAYYIGIDVGSGSVRACVLKDDGDILSTVTKDITTWNYAGDFYEQSSEEIWASAGECVKEAISKAGVDKNNVKGVGFDATCSLVVLDSQTKEPISVSAELQHKDNSRRNIVLWADHRAHRETEHINTVCNDHVALKFTGGKVSLEMETPKILWLKKNNKDYAKSIFFDLCDFLTFKATGDASRSLCATECKQNYISSEPSGFSNDYFTAIGLEDLVSAKFKQLGGKQNGVDGVRFLGAGDSCGKGLTEESAKSLGLLPGTKVGSSIIDCYAGWIGTAAAKVHQHTIEESPDSRLCVVAGTSTCHLVTSNECIFVNGIWGPYKDIVLPGKYFAEGGQSSTGSLLLHLVTTHVAYNEAKAKADEKGISIYHFLNERIEALRERDEGKQPYAVVGKDIFVYPDFHGNRSPIQDSFMRGAVIGLTLEKDIDALARLYYGGMEAIGLQTRQIIDTLNAAGHKISSIFMSGGQCKNPVLMHLMASCTQLPVVIPEYIDSAVVLGAAMLSAKSDDETIWDVMKRMSKPGRLVEPTNDRKEKSLLEAKYKIFKNLAEQQQNMRSAVEKALEE